MECSNVVGTTDGTIGVIGGTTEIASGMGIGGAEVGDAGVGGVVSIRSSPCSVGTGVDCAYCLWGL